jgi:hypothetical protein
MARVYAEYVVPVLQYPIPNHRVHSVELSMHRSGCPGVGAAVVTCRRARASTPTVAKNPPLANGEDELATAPPTPASVVANTPTHPTSQALAYVTIPMLPHTRTDVLGRFFSALLHLWWSCWRSPNNGRPELKRPKAEVRAGVL